MRLRALNIVIPGVAALLLGACGDGAASDQGTDGAANDAVGASDSAGSGDDAPARDGGPADVVADSNADTGQVPADAPFTPDGSTGCPSSCPAGQILARWNLGAPGFPGPSGCACKPDPCPDGGTACSCNLACQQIGETTGCCNWDQGTLMCNGCG